MGVGKPSVCLGDEDVHYRKWRLSLGFKLEVDLLLRMEASGSGGEADLGPQTVIPKVTKTSNSLGSQ